MLTFQSIQSSVVFMDETYDANFGEWIRNEENARIVGYNLRKYVNIYERDSIIIIIKWVVKDWTLRNIISLMKKMIIEDLQINTYKKLDIVAGVIYTWNPVFVGEFFGAMLKAINKYEQKVIFAELLFKDFSKKKIEGVINHVESKMDINIRNMIVKRKSIKRKRSTKIKGAYTATK